ncbi:Zinc knuckle CX2CX4HX4C [Sesbania bispinosa]|nr:Zinc knuckle CX2CX4HX4C [Sesbania bispinosa]
MTTNAPQPGRCSPSRRNTEPNLIIFYEEDIQEGLNECGNSIVGKLISGKSFHVNSLLNAFTNIWNRPKGFKVVDLGEKIFQFFFHEARDMERVLKAMGIANSLSNQANGKRIGACMGTVFEADIYEIQGKGPYIRVSVEIDISKPLLPGINTGSKKDGVFWVDFQYEKLPQFCYTCGLIGHDDEECNGAHDKGAEENSLGPWMRTSQIGKKKKLTQELLEKLYELSFKQPESTTTRQIEEHTVNVESEEDRTGDEVQAESIPPINCIGMDNVDVQAVAPLSDHTNIPLGDKPAPKR